MAAFRLDMVAAPARSSTWNARPRLHVKRHRSASRETFFGCMAAFRPDMVDSCSAFSPDMAAFLLDMVDSCSAFTLEMASFRLDVPHGTSRLHVERFHVERRLVKRRETSARETS